MPTLTEDVTPGTEIARDHHVHRGSIREDSPSSLTGLLTLQALLLHEFKDIGFVAVESFPIVSLEVHYKTLVTLQGGRNNRLSLGVVDIPLTNNREGQVSVSSQLSQKSTRNTADKERHRRVLQDTEVPLVDDVLQVVLIPGRLEIRPVERLVAESAGELGQNVRVGRVADLISLVAVGILHAARVSDRVGQNINLHGSP